MRALLVLGALLVAIMGEPRKPTPLELAYGGPRLHPAWGVLALVILMMVV